MFAADLDEPEPPPPAVESERPVWLGPQTGELGVAVPLGLVLDRTERGFVAVSHALAYSTGVSFDLVAHVAGLKPSEINGIFHDQHAGRAGVEELPDGFLRFGVEQANGTRVSNLGRHRFVEPGASPSGPVLFQNGGGGGQSSGTSVTWSLGYWLWPLPPEGPFRLYAEWPVAAISMTYAEIDAAVLREAAGRAEKLWSDGATPGGWTSVGQHELQARTLVREPRGEDEAEQTVAVPLAQVRRLESTLQEGLRILRELSRT